MTAGAQLTAEAQVRRAEVLLEVSRDCASGLTLDDVLQAFVEIAVRELGCDRGSVFLNDDLRNELFTRYAKGDLKREIRISNRSGIAGHVFQGGDALIVNDPYNDDRFDRSADDETGYLTRNIICCAIHTMSGRRIGVVQCLNRPEAGFEDADIDLLQALTSQAAVSFESQLRAEDAERVRHQELEFLNLVAAISAEVELPKLLARVVDETTRMLSSERATIFLNDQVTQTLFSLIQAGAGVNEIRFPNHLGIAGAVFQSGESLNIPYAYADLRFNPAVDKSTGFFTRSILCVPIRTKDGRVVGVTQVLNKKGGLFTQEDERRLIAFTAQVAVALENAKLFEDVRRIKVYNENVLQSMSNGVITLDDKGTIVSCNAAAERIWSLSASALRGVGLSTLLDPDDAWLGERIETVRTIGATDSYPDCDLALGGVRKSVNLTISQLVLGDDGAGAGAMLLMEDISDGKRMLSTMSRYMDPVIAARMLDEGGGASLGGSSAEATIMFTDIRGFTPITEEYGAEGTVSFLNDYFSRMVDCISREEGMLDKFIGDAIMACFGLPVPQEDSADRGVRAAIDMIRALWAWNAERLVAGLRTVDMGVGLHTDNVVAGNIGSPKRMDFTVIGDGVNLASRLESACKAYGARILASEATVSKLRGVYRMRDIDLVVVKGKTQPVRVYEVLDFHTPETFPHLLDVVGYFNEGIGEYRAARWEKAMARFQGCLDRNPNDKLSAIYIDRCTALKQTPPPADWNGVWVMNEK